MRPKGRIIVIYVAAMVAILVLLSFAGDNGFVYGLSLLGVPIASGVLVGLGLLRFWHAASAVLAIVVLDVVFDETRGEDAVFFVVLGLVMLGFVVLTQWLTRRIVRRDRIQ